LQALPYLPLGSGALALVEDALRANDTRLIAAAVGPYAARHLDPHSWRHAVLKCLFTGVPLTAVADLERRAHADGELARMLADYARERTAASRPVSADLHRALDLTRGDTSRTDPRTGTDPAAVSDRATPTAPADPETPTTPTTPTAPAGSSVPAAQTGTAGPATTSTPVVSSLPEES
ncbi:EboA domain-containing protein, partial [Streptomyces sp. H27-D2]|uniref:EboA domain-containing protein n=1 Tax=Streptomyces sp. H27-D2 TaxID=3046304 RepID=UPI002DBCCE57